MDEIKCGDYATTLIGNIKGMITAVLNRFGRIQYGFTYNMNGELREMWIVSSEITITSAHKENEVVGFKNNA